MLKLNKTGTGGTGMKISFIESVALALLVFCIMTITRTAKAETVDFFIMAGQSNMCGHGTKAAEYPKNPIDDKVLFYNGKEPGWGHMHPSIKEGFGPEVAFSRALVNHGYHPAIFKYAVGGTSLSHDWGKRGDKRIYDSMLKELDIATKTLRARGATIRYSGFVWVQGESDTLIGISSSDYENKVSELIKDIRRIALNPRLPVILGTGEKWEPSVKDRSVILAQKHIAQTDHHVIFESASEGIELMSDNAHITSSGMMVYGERVFDGFFQLSSVKH
jgi:hypothetical protein